MVRLLGEIEPHVSPAGRLSVRDTVPVKVPCEVTVTVDVPDAPALIVMLVAEIVKSAVAKVNVAGGEGERVPLAPTIVTVDGPKRALHVKGGGPELWIMFAGIVPDAIPDVKLSG